MTFCQYDIEAVYMLSGKSPLRLSSFSETLCQSEGVKEAVFTAGYLHAMTNYSVCCEWVSSTFNLNYHSIYLCG